MSLSQSTMSSSVSQNQIQTATATATAADSGKNVAAKIDRTRELPKESGDWAPKSSFGCLSAESLELCTEILGSETGCDFAPASNLFSSAPVLSSYSAPIDKGAEIVDEGKTKLELPKGKILSFPPPMKRSAQMRRRDADGRRIIGPPSYKMVERSEGRARLSFLPLGEIDEEKEEYETEHPAAEKEAEEEDVEGRCQGNKWKRHAALWVAISNVSSFLIYKLNIWAGH